MIIPSVGQAVVKETHISTAEGNGNQYIFPEWNLIPQTTVVKITTYQLFAYRLKYMIEEY